MAKQIEGVKYNSRAEKSLINKMVENGGNTEMLDHAHASLIYNNYYNILGKELKKPNYADIYMRGIGVFYINKNKMFNIRISLVKKYHKYIEMGKSHFFDNDFYDNVRNYCNYFLK